MLKSKKITIFQVAGAAILLSGCAAPKASYNPAASASQAPSNVPLASKPTIGKEVSAVAQNSIDVPFTTGSANLSSDADRQLDLAARLFRDASPVAMYVSGHADSSGDEYQNVLISAKRAQIVKQALVARGISADRLLIQALGASDPVANSNPDDPSNRRAVITWRLF